VVDGWYLSINGLPFWPVENVHNGLPHYAAACDYSFVGWPEDKNLRDEVPRGASDMRVVFSKVKPPDAKEVRAARAPVCSPLSPLARRDSEPVAPFSVLSPFQCWDAST
jgi:hypothetical protein